MPHEILSVKLHELDEQLSRIYSRLLMIETADHDQIRSEKAHMLQECKAAEQSIRERLQNSESPVVTSFRCSYDDLTDIAEDIRAKTSSIREASSADTVDATEQKILLAEYALDFAMLASDHALLLSLEAMDSQMSDEESEGIISA